MKKNKRKHVKNIDQKYIDDRAAFYARAGYSKAKWMIFCEQMLKRNYHLSMYEMKRTVSKYITVTHPFTEKKFTVRFSDHKPIAWTEAKGTCDFFVGVTHQNITNTQQAVQATIEALGECRRFNTMVMDIEQGKDIQMSIIHDPTNFNAEVNV